ncbi:single-stranded DNA-binding protein (plasmid) [Clostridium beijerinckii]|uniref:single-stranded DNA-binding protein n=1 Tax=Clostridium beijerinckii TaxID=1520 RepID=UPI002227E7EF|nr:single-stranded DNA-binding protein [Clostridium beijerinckii]UYZ39002.1 single-stranded DNA-binding protein [Clostridium beijerinckii]
MGSMDLNSVDLIGRLTKDPVLQKTPTNQKSVVRFKIAVNNGKEQADFIPIVAWGKQAEYVANHIKQGDQISVNKGRISCRSYKTESGIRTIMEVIAANYNGIKLINKKKSVNQKYAVNEDEEVSNNCNQEFTKNEISDDVLFGEKNVLKHNIDDDELFKMSTSATNFNW